MKKVYLEDSSTLSVLCLQVLCLKGVDLYCMYNSKQGIRLQFLSESEEHLHIPTPFSQSSADRLPAVPFLLPTVRPLGTFYCS